jgi:hypothetical protein
MSAIHRRVSHSGYDGMRGGLCSPLTAYGNTVSELSAENQLQQHQQSLGYAKLDGAVRIGVKWLGRGEAVQRWAAEEIREIPHEGLAETQSEQLVQARAARTER